MTPDQPREWTICARCASEGACDPCEPIVVVEKFGPGLALPYGTEYREERDKAIDKWIRERQRREEAEEENQTACYRLATECERRKGAERQVAKLEGALEQIAIQPCSNGTSGECPDHWAIGASMDKCPPCAARSALWPVKKTGVCEQCEGSGKLKVLDRGRANDAGISDPTVPCPHCAAGAALSPSERGVRRNA